MWVYVCVCGSVCGSMCRGGASAWGGVGRAVCVWGDAYVGVCVCMWECVRKHLCRTGCLPARGCVHLSGPTSGARPGRGAGGIGRRGASRVSVGARRSRGRHVRGGAQAAGAGGAWPRSGPAPRRARPRHRRAAPRGGCHGDESLGAGRCVGAALRARREPRSAEPETQPSPARGAGGGGAGAGPGGTEGLAMAPGGRPGGGGGPRSAGP